MRSRSRGSPDAGSVTAEFAVLVPVVMLVLAGCMSCLQLAGQQLRLQDTAAAAARSIARGEPVGQAAARADRAVHGVRLAVQDDGDLVCVTLSAQSATLAALVTLQAASCAPGDGR